MQKVDMINKHLLNNTMWNLFFDGVKSQNQQGEGILLQDENKSYLGIPYRLDFSCTNNVAEYEALLLGLRKAKQLRVQNIKVFK